MIQNFQFSRVLRLILSSTCCCCLLALLASTANATIVAGDPSLDAGWTSSGNALDKNNYVIGAANFGFNMYTASFAADSSLAAAIGSGWNSGDTILAMGGKRQSTDGITAGWGIGFSGDPVNSNVTSSARIVAKFGSLVSNTVSPSTVQPGGGNGLGSFSGGNLGDAPSCSARPTTAVFSPPAIKDFS